MGAGERGGVVGAGTRATYVHAGGDGRGVGRRPDVRFLGQKRKAAGRRV